jgi:hypothetical protein
VGISGELIIIKVADSYWEETTGGRLYYLPGTAWIRLSTGKLCMDVGNGYEPCGDVVPSPRFWTPEMPSLKLTENDLAGKLKCTLELDEFYSLLTRGNRAFLQISSSTPGTITAPSIYNPNCNHAHFEPDGFCAIPTAKHLTVDDLYIDSWSTSNLPQEVLPTGWTRCASGCSAPSFSNNCSAGLIIQSVTHIRSGLP